MPRGEFHQGYFERPTDVTRTARIASNPNPTLFRSPRGQRGPLYSQPWAMGLCLEGERPVSFGVDCDLVPLLESAPRCQGEPTELSALVKPENSDRRGLPTIPVALLSLAFFAKLLGHRFNGLLVVTVSRPSRAVTAKVPRVVTAFSFSVAGHHRFRRALFSIHRFVLQEASRPRSADGRLEANLTGGLIRNLQGEAQRQRAVTDAQGRSQTR
jgi:hypothetical protein